MFPRALHTLLLLVLTLAPTALAAPPAQSSRALDLHGQVLEIPQPRARATVVVFLSTDCPIANGYLPDLNTLYTTWAPEAGVQLVGVLSDPTLKRPAVNDWYAAYHVAFPVVIDTTGDLAKRLDPSRTPEAFVLDRDGAVRYRGRIDDRYLALGKKRQVTQHHDLEDAVAAVLAGRDIPEPRTTPVGCFFEAWNRPATTQPAAATYARDVAPILYANCVNCHRPGQVAPFPLLTYDDAAKRAELIASVTADRYMPPWKPADGVGHFLGQRRLTDAQIAALKSFADAHAPKGDDSELPPAPQFSDAWALGQPDLVVKMSEPYDVPAAGPDAYRAFVLPTELLEDRMIVATEFRPGNPRVVHHALLYLDTSGAARKRDAADPGPGYASFGGPGFVPSGGLGGWAPGATPSFLPDGMGRPIKKGADVVFQIHYHPDGKPETDQSTLALYFAKKPVTQVVANLMLATRNIDIPAGDNHYTRRATLTVPADVTVTGVFPHMHLLGKQMTVTATTPAGTVIPLIQIDDWDFKWQDQYLYATPLKLPKGTTLELSATYDNSDANPNNPNHPPQPVHHGEQTTDEMCLCFVQIAVPTEAEARTLRRQMVRDQLLNRLLSR
jgi:mono/diheme cytochrome c family protein